MQLRTALEMKEKESYEIEFWYQTRNLPLSHMGVPFLGYKLLIHSLLSYQKKKNNLLHS